MSRGENVTYHVLCISAKKKLPTAFLLPCLRIHTVLHYSCDSLEVRETSFLV